MNGGGGGREGAERVGNSDQKEQAEVYYGTSLIFLLFCFVIVLYFSLTSYYFLLQFLCFIRDSVFRNLCTRV